MSLHMSDNSATTTSSGRRLTGKGRVLVVVGDDHNWGEFSLPESGSITIGRSSTADITVDHPTLSRLHVRLTLGAHITIEDLGSRNGTSVGGRQVAHGETVLVAPGTPIEIGDLLIIVRTYEKNVDLLTSTASNMGGTPGTRLERALLRVARSDVNALLLGERGAGKMHTARRIHAASIRATEPLVSLVCSESTTPELVRDAAIRARGATLLVLEPTRLSALAQEALLHALAEVTPGVRTITITEDDLPQLAGGPFDARLHGVLAGVTILVPPLRARLSELPQIAERILWDVAAKRNRPAPLLSADAIAALSRHTWPGNVAELEAVLTRAALLRSGRVITAAHLEVSGATRGAGAGEGSLSSAVSEAEHRRILEALRQCDGNQTRAAKLLGVSRGTLISRLERYGVPRPRK